jgi:hypothetical protein
MFGLDSLAGITMGDEPCNVHFHSTPPILLSYIHIHLGGSWVDGICRVVGLIHNSLPEVSIICPYQGKFLITLDLTARIYDMS